MADILKEFLVAIGFKINDAQAKKLNEGLAKVEKGAKALAATATAAAVAVEAAVVKMSAGFEDLYYASQRIGDTADKIKGLDYAISQVGGTARGARAALESVAEFMRSNPGGERFINGLGVATRDASGHLRGMTDVFDDLGKRFRSMPYAQAKVRAQLLGIDPITLQAMIRGTGEFRKRYADMAKSVGVDQQKAAVASKNFMQSIRDLQARLELLAAKVLIALQGPAGRALERFADTGIRVLGAFGQLALRLIDGLDALNEATGGWATTAALLLAALGPIVAILGPTAAGVVALGIAILALVDDFMVWREGGKSLIDWSKWSDEIDSAVAGFGDLMNAGRELWNSLKPFMSWLAGVLVPFMGGALKTTISTLTTTFRLLADVITVITDLLQGKWSKAWDDAKKTVDRAKSGIGDVLGKGASWIANTVKAVVGAEDTASNPSGPSALARERALAAQLAAGGGNALAGDAKALGAQALAYFKSKGWTAEQAAGIVANLARESSLNAKAVGDNGHAFGLAQWHADRQAKFKELFGKDIRQSTFAEQLQFIQHELTAGAERVAGNALRSATTARAAAGVVSRQYERPRDTDLEARIRGDMAERWFARNDLTNGPVRGANVQIDQKTDIHVHGGDAEATAHRVANQQERVNGNLIRHTKSAVS